MPARRRRGGVGVSPRGRNLDPPEFIAGAPVARELTSVDMREVVDGLMVQVFDDQTGRRMTREEYREVYLESPEWRAIRGLAIERAGRRCADCGLKDESTHNLDAHHLTYARLGHELLADLVVVCRRCHNERHRAVAP